MVDLNEGVEPVPQAEDLSELQPMPTTYSPVFVNDRVFVTWYESSQDDNEAYLFVSEPKHVELPEHQAQQVQDLMNHQMDQMQGLLQTFIEGDGTEDTQAFADTERMVGTTGHLDV